MNKYYDILDLPENATVDDIRKAYRSKAKQFHPDRNKTPGAQEKFVEVNEAYEYLINLKEGKITSSGDAQIDDFARWWRREEARVREEAHRKSRMRYRAYRKAENATEKAEEEKADVIVVVFAIIAVFLLPILLSIWQGWTGFWISIGIIIASFQVTGASISRIRKLGADKFLVQAKGIVKTYWFIATIVSTVNVVTFFNIGFKTLIPLQILLLLYAGIIAVSFVFTLVIKFKNQQRKLVSLVLGPAVITVLLMVNFWVSFNPVKESYYFSLNREIRSKNGRVYYKTSSLMQLENNKYDEYFGLRAFIDINEIRRSNYVTFTFKKGILGFRVLKEYKLELDLTPTPGTDTSIN
ncbi:MAG TPA: DnaJ domain-containing protein [Bacteroidia bacterium]|nr:DnaJ domain-containing protein [Bacteroidia bacterium]